MENFLPGMFLKANWTGQVLEREDFAPGMSEVHKKKNTLQDLTLWTQFLQQILNVSCLV